MPATRSRGCAFLQIAGLIAAVVALAVFFPRVLRFLEMATRELRYFWWVILLVALAVWLIWGIGRKRPGGDG